MSIEGNELRRDRRAEVRFVFSVMVATVSEGFEDDEGSKLMLLPDTPSHTCMA
jgi:hypothetical protein